ncbi:MAG: hypothetical protein KJP02_02095, partial [Octadecabacter sp.]|nr:hypothetical protein [Octadecabacter sp.]
MAPLDECFLSAAEIPKAGVLRAPMIAPVVKDFDPSCETLGFTLGAEDEDAQLVLRDLIDGSGVRVEVNGRLMVTLMGCVADDIPEGCLTFDFE